MKKKHHYHMSSSSKSIFDSSTTSTTNDNDPSTLDTDDNVADLRLLSKRMAINIERLDDEINQIVNKHKKFKLKKLKMKRYKYKNKRPQTSVASVPTLALSKSTVISDKNESQKQQQQQNIQKSKSLNTLSNSSTEVLRPHTVPLSTKVEINKDVSMHDTSSSSSSMKKDIDFKAICKSLEQSPTENTNILLYQKRTQALRRSLSVSAKMSPVNQTNLSETESFAKLQNYVNTHPKLQPINREIDISSFTEARRNLYKLEHQKQKWSNLISKEIRASMTSKMNILKKWQQKWIAILKHGIIATIFEKAVLHGRNHRKETQAKIEAISKIQHSYRKSYSKRMELKHKRTVEILRKRAWVARMNVKARHRKESSQLIRKFCLTFVGRPKFVELIKKFKYKVIICQRFIKGVHDVRQSMITTISKYWSKLESDVLVQMELEEVRRERQRAMRKLKARRRTQVRKKNAVISEREIQKAMSEMAITLGNSKQDLQRAKNREKAKKKIENLNDLLAQRTVVHKKHGGVIALKNASSSAATLNSRTVQGPFEFAKKKRAHDAFIKQHSPSVYSRFEPAPLLLRRTIIGEWLKQKQSEFIEVKEALLEERERKKLHVTVEDVKSMMKTVSNGEDDDGDYDTIKNIENSNKDTPLIYDNMMDNPRNADQPIVFNVYSKYMKDDMENLIRESIRRNEEERTRFLTLLNSDTSANFNRRRHKRMSITAGKILKARFGGSLHYYNHLR